MISSRRLICMLCLVVIVGSLIIDNNGHLAMASKKKFLKGFILGALLSKSHGIPVIYMQEHGGGGHHKHHGGYGY